MAGEQDLKPQPIAPAAPDRDPRDPNALSGRMYPWWARDKRDPGDIPHEMTNGELAALRRKTRMI